MTVEPTRTVRGVIHRLSRRAGALVLPRAGVRVRRVAGDAVLVQRRSRPLVQVRELARDRYLLEGPGQRSRVVRVGRQAWLVSTRRFAVAKVGAARLLSPGRTPASVREVAPGQFLVRETAAPAAALGSRPHRAVEKAVANLLNFDHLTGLLAMYRVDCVLDVGANQGQFATRLRRAGYTGRIISFEPSPEVYEILERRAADDPAWETHCLALGPENTTMSLNHHPDQTGMTSLLEPSAFGQTASELQRTVVVQVPVRRLEDVLDEHVPAGDGARLFLKMDTQGYDLQVFEGLGTRVEDVVGLQSELSLIPLYEGTPRLYATLEVYEAAGFEITAVYPVRRQYRTARLIECDCLMVRASAR